MDCSGCWLWDCICVGHYCSELQYGRLHCSPDAVRVKPNYPYNDCDPVFYEHDPCVPNAVTFTFAYYFSNPHPTGVSHAVNVALAYAFPESHAHQNVNPCDSHGNDNSQRPTHGNNDSQCSALVDFLAYYVGESHAHAYCINESLVHAYYVCNTLFHFDANGVCYPNRIAEWQLVSNGIL